MFKVSRIFLYIQAVLYPLVIFCGLVFFKLPPRIIALFVGFIALGYFLVVSVKKKRVVPRGGSYSLNSYSPWAVPSCSSALVSFVL
ncbi:MAG: hypothetical protein LBB78_04275 [Spirochaetaceae bacterium]|jgi:hypothetical protein|nr:hypothetical protein [Spirochaetaceae bacterium]